MGPECRLGAVGDPELLEDVGQVGLDRSIGDAQPPGDVLVGQPLGHQREHLALPWSGRVTGRLDALLVQQDPGRLGIERRAAGGRRVARPPITSSGGASLRM